MTTRLTILLAVTTAVFVPLGPGRLHAAEQDKKIQLLFSDKADDPAPHDLFLRPTVQQQLFVYVKNNTAADEPVTVEVLAGDAPVAGAVQTFTAKANDVTPVDFSKSAAPPAAPPAPPAVAPPGPKPPAPPPEEAKGPVVVRVLDKDRKELHRVVLQPSPPSSYIQLDPKSLVYDPKTRRLAVTVKALSNFGAGPKCRIDLVLRPDRVPGLIEAPHAEGTRGGYIAKADGVLPLTAENLQFDPTVDRKNGLVYLTIDGWERAYTFATTFPADEGQQGKPTPVNGPVVRLDAVPFANPGAPYPVRLEADNIAPDETVEVGIDRDNDGFFKAENNEIVPFQGGRRVHVFLSAAGPGGCLLVQPTVEDWKTELDVANVFGDRVLQVRVLNGGQEVKFLGSTPPAPGEVVDPLGVLVAQLRYTVTLEGGGPAAVKLLDFPKELKRGADLPVRAACGDDPSKIKEVFFYVGKPGPDGNPPPMAVKTPADPVTDKDTKKTVWAASLSAPTDLKGKFDVTVQFVNKANLNGTDTKTIQLVDPPAPKGPGDAAKGGTIEGVVTEGGRGQPGLEVRLLDDKGAVKDAVKTDAAGKFLFKDVAAGSYKVVSAKTTDSTKGETGAQVIDGKNKTDADIKLQR